NDTMKDGFLNCTCLSKTKCRYANDNNNAFLGNSAHHQCCAAAGMGALISWRQGAKFRSA
ncbi:MAG: hypothetical protein ACKVP1_18755, partial [Burkholderiaceae bacterium]